MSNSQIVKGYFQFDPEGFSVAVVLKDFWDKNQCLEDANGSTYGLLEQEVPKGFFELGDSVFEHTFESTEKAKEELVKASFIEKKLF